MNYTLEQLKEIATKLNYKAHHNVSAAKLQDQLVTHSIELGTTLDEVAKSMGFVNASPTMTTLAQPAIENEPSIPNTQLDNDKIERLKNLTFGDAEVDNSKKESALRTKEAMRLIRCIISCNNKNKSAYQGEIFAVRNAVLPEIKKMIPFNVPTHIPQIMLNMIREKQYQMFKTEKINGRIIKKPYLVAEYNIQLLDPISKEEFEAIRKKQLAEGKGQSGE